jgi:tetratricopeptide (TPR) repeat protein
MSGARLATLARAAALSAVLFARPAAGQPAPRLAPTPDLAHDPAAHAADPWQEARRLADAGQFERALAVLRAGLAHRPDAFGLRWLEAGITGEAGRHKESVALYEKLGADYPERAGELRGDLAAERLWADDPAGAARDFRVWLAAKPADRLATRRLALALAESDSLKPAIAAYDSLVRLDPKDTDLALERARVLGWLGRHDDAIAAYRAVLARDSTVAAARLGIAMNENWAGRHRAAQRDLAPLVGGPDADPDAGKALAFARWWDDDPDGARRTLDDYLRRFPNDAEARELSERIAREQRPSLRFEGGRANDSDGLDVRTTAMELRFPLGAGTDGSLSWRRDNLRDAGGTQDPLRYGASLRHRFSREWSAYAEGVHTDPGSMPGVRDGGSLGLVLRPVDRLRLEGAVSREPVLTRRSVELGVTLLTWVGAVDVSPNEALALHGDARVGSYSDQNRSDRFGLRARWRAWQGPRAELALTLSGEQLRVHHDLDDGYYDPAFHREGGPGFELEVRPAPRWTLGADATTGWQHDRGESGWPAFYNAHASAQWRASARWTLGLEGGRSDSSLQSAGGYERKWWLGSLEYGF